MRPNCSSSVTASSSRPYSASNPLAVVRGGAPSFSGCLEAILAGDLGRESTVLNVNIQTLVPLHLLDAGDGLPTVADLDDGIAPGEGSRGVEGTEARGVCVRSLPTLIKAAGQTDSGMAEKRRQAFGVARCIGEGGGKATTGSVDMDCALADLTHGGGRNREKRGIDAAGNITPIGGNGPGGGGGSGRAGVNDGVDDGEIGLVTDAGDDGHAAGVDGAGDDFFVEWPQLFDGAAATSENDDVDVDEPVQLPDGFSYADCGLGALDRARGEDDLRERPATAKDVADVVEYSGGRRGNDADAGGEAGQGAFAGLVEEAVGGELLLEAFEFRLASAHSGRLYEIDDQLDVAALLVEGDAAVG